MHNANCGYMLKVSPGVSIKSNYTAIIVLQVVILHEQALESTKLCRLYSMSVDPPLNGTS